MNLAGSWADAWDCQEWPRIGVADCRIGRQFHLIALHTDTIRAMNPRNDWSRAGLSKPIADRKPEIGQHSPAVKCRIFDVRSERVR